MELVFAAPNHLQSRLATLSGEALFRIKTTPPDKLLVPITQIVRMDSDLYPEAMQSGRRRGLNVTESRWQHVADIQWRGLGTPTLIFSHMLDSGAGVGMPASQLLKKRNPLSLHVELDPYCNMLHR